MKKKNFIIVAMRNILRGVAMNGNGNRKRLIISRMMR